MNIKHGDIITLDSGDTARVSLEIIKKITQLTVGKKYELQYTGQFCHIATTREKTVSNERELENSFWIFVGMIYVGIGYRYVFLSDTYNSTYTMFSTSTLNFVVKEVN